MAAISKTTKLVRNFGLPQSLGMQLSKPGPACSKVASKVSRLSGNPLPKDSNEMANYPLKNLDMMPEIKEILAKNKAVLPNIATVTSKHNLGNSAARGKKKGVVTKIKEWRKPHFWAFFRIRWNDWKPGSDPGFAA